MSFVFLNEPGNIVFVVNLFGVFSNCKLFEQVELGCSQRNTLSGEKLMHHVFPYVAESLRIQYFERVKQSLSGGRLELVGHEHLQHVGLEPFVFNEITGLIVFKLRDNVISHLSL